MGEKPPHQTRECDLPSLSYSFAQLEAFTAVAAHGSLVKAAAKLGKDRTTLRDLIDLLEDGLGYALFVREGKTLQLTPEGDLLQRQAQLLMRQARAFEQFACQVPSTETQALSVVYDAFTPRKFIHGLIAVMAKRQVRLSLTCMPREAGERALAAGQADMGFYQANNRSIGTEMEWRAIGTLEMDFYASQTLFAQVAMPCSLLDLSLTPQVVMHSASDIPVSQRLQIAGSIIFTNELEMLRGLIESGCGWGFLPTHFQAARWDNVSAIPVAVGNEGISQTMVTLWRPGHDKRRIIDEVLTQIPALWKSAGI